MPQSKYEEDKRAAELVAANKERAFQNEEKEKRAAELVVADIELNFQNKEKEDMEETQRALLNILEDYAEEKRKVESVNNSLISANKELEQFAYVASHDLQEPLRTISNFAGLLQKKYAGKIDKDADAYTGIIVKAATKMQNLIKYLLDFSRIGRNVSQEAVDCNEIVEEVIAGMNASITESNAKITFPTLPVLQGNKLELNQLFQNVISNAIKFRKKDVAPVVEITVEEKGNEYLFAIKDNGIGMEDQYKERIFILFQRLHNVSDYPGTGIGLALCKKIVRLYNGEVWIESTLGEGSTLYFTIRKENVS